MHRSKDCRLRWQSTTETVPNCLDRADILRLEGMSLIYNGRYSAVRHGLSGHQNSKSVVGCNQMFSSTESDCPAEQHYCAAMFLTFWHPCHITISFLLYLYFCFMHIHYRFVPDVFHTLIEVVGNHTSYLLCWCFCEYRQWFIISFCGTRLLWVNILRPR